MKIKYFLVFWLIFLPSLGYTQRQKISHRWAVQFALLEQNGPFKEFVTISDFGLYVMQVKYGQVGKAAMGGAFGFSYDITFRNNIMLRLQTQLETTGWISGILDLGIGANLRINHTARITIEAYFSIQQTGGTLRRLNLPTESIPDTKSLYLGSFGFKGRISIPVVVKSKYFIAPYISYAVYPLHASNVEELVINGYTFGALIDSFQIGFEFGGRF